MNDPFRAGRPPLVALYMTCAAPRCGRTATVRRRAWYWAQNPPVVDGWRCVRDPHYGAAYIYCPAHAFRYRGRTPAGRRLRPARRPGYRLLPPRRVLRIYSTDRRPCRCGAAARPLVATFGTRWRQARWGHFHRSGCPTCGGDLHGGIYADHCLVCGYVHSRADEL